MKFWLMVSLGEPLDHIWQRARRCEQQVVGVEHDVRKSKLDEGRHQVIPSCDVNGRQPSSKTRIAGTGFSNSAKTDEF